MEFVIHDRSNGSSVTNSHQIANAINFPFKPNASIIELILGFFMHFCSKRYYLNHSVGLRRLLIVPLAILLLFVYAIFGAQNIDGTSL